MKSDFETNFSKIDNFYKNDLVLMSSLSYGTQRQHNYNSLTSSLPLNTTLLDYQSNKKLLDYNMGFDYKLRDTGLNLNRLTYNTRISPSYGSFIKYNFQFLYKNLKNTNLAQFNYYLSLSNFSINFDIDSDLKQPTNAFKYLLGNNNFRKKSLYKVSQLNEDLNFSDLTITPNFNNFSNMFLNSNSFLKEKNLKSPNSQYLASERTPRLISNLTNSVYRLNLLPSMPNYTNLLNFKINNISVNQCNLYDFSLLNWPDYNTHLKLHNNIVHMPITHTPPRMSNNPFFLNTSFDFFTKNKDDITPMVLRSKEESAPPHVFNTYWLSYWGLTSNNNKLTYINNLHNLTNSIYIPLFTEYSEYDFQN